MTTGRHKTCMFEIQEKSAISMTELLGITICGKRGGSHFLETLRPNTDGECPSNTVACSDLTSPENTICVDPRGTEDEFGSHSACPITDIKIIDSVEAFSFAANSYKILDFNQENLKLAYTKIDADSLPIQ